MSGDQRGDDEVQLSTVISLPRDLKNQLRLLCTRRGLSMKDYVERLVRSALGISPLPTSREKMAPTGERAEPLFEETQQCKYGCNYRIRSKSGLAQHEGTCTFQRARSAQERARAIEAERGTQL